MPASCGTMPRDPDGVKRSASSTTHDRAREDELRRERVEVDRGAVEGLLEEGGEHDGYGPIAWNVSPIAVSTGSVTWKMRFG